MLHLNIYHLLPLPLLLLTTPLLTIASATPYPALVSDNMLHLMPRHTLFYRQVSNLQTFTGSTGGASASAITNSGDAKRPFEVDGDTFTDFKTAAQRSCDNQFQGCQQTANANGGGNKGGLSVNDCDTQKDQCNSAQDSAKVQSFDSGSAAATTIIPDPEFGDQGFELVCDA